VTRRSGSSEDRELSDTECNDRDKEACNYRRSADIASTIGSWTERDGAKSTFRYYASQSAVTAEHESADGAYQPSVSGAKSIHTM
jgi:hypothetical protein